MKMQPQLVRLLLLTVMIVVTYALARVVLTPRSFGELDGWYRADALPEIAAQPLSYAGRKDCATECHSEIDTVLSGDSHRNLSCEGCHGPGQAHAENPDIKIGHATTADCLRCHATDPSRPATHKQVKQREHYPDAKCVECHKPHQPKEAP